jgi:CBS domain-containing protein
MLVRELMTSPAVTVRSDETARETIRLLERFSITAVPVVDSHGAPIGIVSEADLLRDAVLPDQRAHVRPVSSGDAQPGLRVRDVMTRQVICVSADEDLATAVSLMQDTAIKSLPVLLHGRVVGVISRRDIISTLARQDEDIAREIDDLVRRAGQDWLISVEDGVVTVEGTQEANDERLARVLAGSVPGVSAIRLGTTTST